jgi:hypothetical protein
MLIERSAGTLARFLKWLRSREEKRRTGVFALLFPLIVAKSNPAEGGRHLRLGWFALGNIKRAIKKHLLEAVTFCDHLSNRQLIFCTLPPFPPLDS